MTDEQLKADLRLRHPEADDGFEVEYFLGRYGSALDALMYARLFWPAFFLEKGMIFTAHAVKVHGALDKIQLPVSDPTEMEKSFNLVELPYNLFQDLDITDEQFDDLVEKIREMWTARLQMLYPRQKFIVEVEPLDPSDPESDLGLTVYQDRT